MKTSMWIKISARRCRYGGTPKPWEACGAEVRKSKPATGPNEIALKLEVEIPDAYFEVPEFSATISVPDSAMDKPVIAASVQDNIAKALSKQLGVKVHVDVTEAQE